MIRVFGTPANPLQDIPRPWTAVLRVHFGRTGGSGGRGKNALAANEGRVYGLSTPAPFHLTLPKTRRPLSLFYLLNRKFRIFVCSSKIQESNECFCHLWDLHLRYQELTVPVGFLYVKPEWIYMYSRHWREPFQDERHLIAELPDFQTLSLYKAWL